MAKQASGSNLVLKRVAEATFGVTPTNPTQANTFQQRFSTYTATLTKNPVTDPTVTGNRQEIYQRFTTSEMAFEMESVLAHADLDDLIASGMWSNWSAEVAGSKTISIGSPAVLKSFTIEADQTDIDVQRRFTGITVNSFTVNSPLDGNTTISFSCLGKEEDKVTQKLPAFTPFTGSEPYTHIDGTLNLSFVTGDDCIVQSFELTVDNQATADFCWGERGAHSVTEDMVMVTGSVTLMYVSGEVNDAYLEGTEGSLVVTLNDREGHSMQFNMPRIVATGAENPFATGNRVVTLPFRALAAVDGTHAALTITSHTNPAPAED